MFNVSVLQPPHLIHSYVCVKTEDLLIDMSFCIWFSTQVWIILRSCAVLLNLYQVKGSAYVLIHVWFHWRHKITSWSEGFSPGSGSSSHLCLELISTVLIRVQIRARSPVQCTAAKIFTLSGVFKAHSRKYLFIQVNLVRSKEPGLKQRGIWS